MIRCLLLVGIAFSFALPPLHAQGTREDYDRAAGLMERSMETAPRDVTATGRAGAIELGWTAYDHQIVAGYNIYRSQTSAVYYGPPHAEVGRLPMFVDRDVIPGRTYFYIVASRDPAGQEHQPSAEVSAAPDPATAGLVPIVPGS